MVRHGFCRAELGRLRFREGASQWSKLRSTGSCAQARARRRSRSGASSALRVCALKGGRQEVRQRRRRPTGTEQGGSVISSPGADIDTCGLLDCRLRRIATQPVSAGRLRPLLPRCKRPEARFAAAPYRSSVYSISGLGLARRIISPIRDDGCRRGCDSGRGPCMVGVGCCRTGRAGSIR